MLKVQQEWFTIEKILGELNLKCLQLHRSFFRWHHHYFFKFSSYFLIAVTIAILQRRLVTWNSFCSPLSRRFKLPMGLLIETIILKGWHKESADLRKKLYSSTDHRHVCFAKYYIKWSDNLICSQRVLTLCFRFINSHIKRLNILCVPNQV
jgi:hypothetical protein